MKSFTDAAGRQWEIVGSLATFERIRSECQVDMLTMPTTQECLRQIQDPYTLGRVLYEACSKQAEARGLAPEDFAGGLTADVLALATDALLEETIFFCRSDLRPALTMAYEKAKARDRKTIQMLTARLPTISLMMDAALERMDAPTGSATSSAASSESTPAIGRSGTSSGQPKASKKKGGPGKAS